MQVNINGEAVTAKSNNLAEILCQYGATEPFAVAINGEFVAKSNYSLTQVKLGDLVDVVAPIFGG